MAGKILEFGKNVKSPQEKPSVQEQMRLPREYRTYRVLDAAKYYILVEPDQAKAMRIVKYLTQTPLGFYTLVTPEVMALIEATDPKKTMIVEMGGEV